MVCETDKGVITDYVSDQMTVDERSAFESHLKDCASCREELAMQTRLQVQKVS